MMFLSRQTSTKSRVFSWQLTLKKHLIVLIAWSFVKKSHLIVLIAWSFVKKSHLIVLIAWSFVKKSPDRFNFGPDIKRRVQTFYTNNRVLAGPRGGR